MITPTYKATATTPGVWSPGQHLFKYQCKKLAPCKSYDPKFTVWIPKSASTNPIGSTEFRSIKFTSPQLQHKSSSMEMEDPIQSKWYKKMYDTIHKQKPHKGEYVTIRYKQRKYQQPYVSGYLSEPEHASYDRDMADKYFDCSTRTLPRQQTNKIDRCIGKFENHAVYGSLPGSIEQKIPGQSSISKKEEKKDSKQRSQISSELQSKSFINQAIKEAGYDSESTVLFRRKGDTDQQLTLVDQKEAYRGIQKGGEIPLHGLRKPAPEKPKDSSRKYLEDEVTIHYKTPVRQEIKEYLNEDVLAYQQSEVMKKIYEEERHRKYLQEKQDINDRRHTDNFTPSQKSHIQLNRYDDFNSLTSIKWLPQPRLKAKALFNFVGQTDQELTFRKGDVIFLRRQMDKNWYEGELNAMVGLFPVNYVEVLSGYYKSLLIRKDFDASLFCSTKTNVDGVTGPTAEVYTILAQNTTKSNTLNLHEGEARVKHNFVAQSNLELSLAKNEFVIITRRVDDNWFEGKIGDKKGIFPVSYVEVLIFPNSTTVGAVRLKPAAVPAAHSLLLNDFASGRESMGNDNYKPYLQKNAIDNRTNHENTVHANGYQSTERPKKSVKQTLHIETHSESIPYQSLYKYLPQNEDELELLEGDTVFVLERCDDGWFIGSNERTGTFGTFPGNYVKII